MPALFAYLLTISIFIGGGYAGLHFLAGDFDAPPLPAKAEKSDGAKSEARMQPAKVRSQPTPAAAPPDPKPLQAEAVAASNSGAAEVEQSPVTSVPPTIAQSAPVEREVQKAPETTNAIPTPVAASSLAATQDSPANPASPTEASTEQIASALGEQSGAGLPADGVTTKSVEPSPLKISPPQSSAMEARAAMKSIPRRKVTRQPARERMAESRQVRPRQAANPMANGFFGRTGPVPMVLRTIELPDGRRVRQILTQDQARMEDD